MSLKINNDGTAGNYTSAQYLGGGTSTAYAGTTAASASGMPLAGIGGSTSPTSYASLGTVQISNYLGTVFFKGVICTNRYDQSGNTLNEIHSAHWKSTAAITRLTFSLPTSFVNGSVFTLYGVGTP